MSFAGFVLACIYLGFHSLAVAAPPPSGAAVDTGAGADKTFAAGSTLAIDEIVRRFAAKSLVLAPAVGTGSAAVSGNTAVEALPQSTFIAALEAHALTDEQAIALWSYLGNIDNIPVVTFPLVAAMVRASATPKAREALWSELSALADAFAKPSAIRRRAQTLLGLFEDRHDDLAPFLNAVRETEGGSDEMLSLMTKSRVFGFDLEHSVAFLSERIPGAMARHIEQQRERGKPVRWEYAAFENMIRWKDTRLIARAKHRPRTLAELDAAGEAFITMFNCLHALDAWFRVTVLRGLGPAEIFNAVIAGEKELYRLGTSGYRGHLHPIIMAGIAKSGSFEAFIDAALPQGLSDGAMLSASRRGMVFLRVVSSFGLLEPVLATVRDRDAFIAGAIASLGDPRAFEANSSVVMELLTMTSATAAGQDFKRALIETLYARYRGETDAVQRNVFGSMLSVYQTVTGDQRDAAIASEFVLDPVAFDAPAERLFSADHGGVLVHRVFMRMDDNIDASSTYFGFALAMKKIGARVSNRRHHAVFTIMGKGRRIEIYANRPDPAGLRRGIEEIKVALAGRRVETVIGRGHTSIIAPLQADARRVLGDRIADVAVVIVGACGGDASVRELIGTFGYIPFFTTKSTGRQVLNNAIIETWIDALLRLEPGDRLSATAVLDRALRWYERQQVNDELRDDARLYQVNIATVLTAQLFDTHVRRLLEPNLVAANR